MELTEAQCRLTEDCLPRQRGNVSLSNLQVLNAILYVIEQCCKWRGVPKHFGRWHIIHTQAIYTTKCLRDGCACKSQPAQ
jgi:transposase